MLLLNEAVQTFCEVSETCQLLSLFNCTDLLVVENWEVTRRTKVCGEFSLEKNLLLPGFNLNNFPFIIVQAKYYDVRETKCPTIDLMNVLTGRMEPLIAAITNSLYN